MSFALRPAAAGSILLACSLSGCTITNFGSDRIDYKGVPASTRSLEVPPELSPLPPNDRFAVPGTATASGTATATPAARPAGSAAAVAPNTPNARIERAGGQRWLAVDVTPEQAYAVVRDFWPSVGLALDREDPAAGIVETVWAENRAKLPQDILRRTLGRLIDGLYSTGEQDRFRTRIERTAKNTAEIYISHRGMEEVFTTAQRDATRWQPRASDPELEAEMLQRLLLRFGSTAAPASPRTAAAPSTPAGAPATGAAAPVAGAAASAAAAQAQTVRLVSGGNGRAERVEIDEPFDRAWRRVGLGLDRGAFTVEDRDRANGVYFVRYLDPEVEAKQRSQQGVLSRLFGGDPKIVAPQYRVLVLSSGKMSTVTVLDKDGKPELSPIGDRILTLLNQQLR
ncbi:MAG: outer membrane protein assembly factor BamC [Betaproteobacteria bacterium]